VGARAQLRRWHIWIGWLVALPVLFWVVSGLVMVWKPIDEVRGTDLLRSAPAIRLLGPPIPPNLSGVPLKSLSLEQRAAGPRWVIRLPDGTTRLGDPLTGLLLPSLSAADAAREVTARYAAEGKVTAISRTAKDEPPLDLRRPVEAWQVTLDDGTHVYVDASSGEILATRTRWWRFYDLMWGFHIMDLKTRENTHNPLILGFGIATLAMAILGVMLLPKALKRRRNSS